MKYVNFFITRREMLIDVTFLLIKFFDQFEVDALPGGLHFQFLIDVIKLLTINSLFISNKKCVAQIWIMVKEKLI